MRRRVLYQAHRISTHSTARELPPSKRTVPLPARPPPAAGGSIALARNERAVTPRNQYDVNEGDHSKPSSCCLVENASGRRGQPSARQPQRRQWR